MTAHAEISRIKSLQVQIIHPNLIGPVYDRTIG
jgi:hypothetical protein